MSALFIGLTRIFLITKSKEEGGILLEYDRNKFSPSWDDIEEEMPDEMDIRMLEAIKTDPECHEFTREQDIVWD